MAEPKPSEMEDLDQAKSLDEQKGGEEEQPVDPLDQSSEVSALTDEEELLRQNQLAAEEAERQRLALLDKKTAETLTHLFLNASRKKYLFLIRNRDVNEELSVLWDALPKNSEANVQLQDVESCFQSIIVLFLAGLETEHCNKFAHELLGSRKMRETLYFTQEEFFEAVLLTADIFLEELDVASATSYAKFLQNRLIFSEVEEGVEVRFFSSSSKGAEPTANSVFCCERLIQNRSNQVHSLKQARFRIASDIKPLGASADEVLMALANEQPIPRQDQNGNILEVLESQVLTPLIAKQETLLYVRFCLTDAAGYPCRLSIAVRNPYFFEVLQTKQKQRVVLNQKSLFKREIEIDKVHELTKRWKDKLVLPQPGPLNIQGKPFEDIFDVLIKAKYSSLNGGTEENLSESRMIDFQSSDTFPSISSEKFKHFETRETQLPTDNLDPYSDDLLEYARERPQHILVHGKPKVGKSKFCAMLAKKLDLEVIDLEIFIQNFLKKVAEGEENIQLDDANNPIEFLKPWERALITSLRKGDRASAEQLVELMNSEIQKLRIDQKGCVMEVPCFDVLGGGLNFMELIHGGVLKCNSNSVQFNIIIELYVDDAGVIARTKQIRENTNPANFITLTDAERLNPPAKKKKDPDAGDDDADPDDPDAGDQDDGDPDDPDNPKIIREENLFQRVNESIAVVKRGLENYKQRVRPLIELAEGQIHHANNIFLDADTLTTEQAVDVVYGKLLPRSQFKRPVAYVLEDAGADDYASLPRLNKKTDEGEPMRRWSLFYKHDPVALYKGRVVRGQSQFSCDFAGRIFCFENEENRAEFLRDPKPFLLKKPELPRGYNVAILGMKNTGKHTFAKMIADKYGLEVVDLPSIALKTFERQSQEDTHSPSNPDKGQVNFSRTEFAEIKKGTPIDPRVALPLLLNEKGITLWKRPPPPKTPEQLEEEERLRKEEEERQKEDAKKKKKPAAGAKADAPKDQAPPKDNAASGNLPLEDVALLDFVPKPDEKGVVPQLKGFVFIDFPVNEAQINSLKEMNIILDKVVILREVSVNEAGDSEPPGATITKRPGFYETTLLADEEAFINAASEAVKAGIEEEKIVEIESGKLENTFFKIRQFIDPFTIRVDDESTQLPSEESDPAAEKVLFGEYGPYCPVCATDDKWLELGKAEFEVQVRGRRYRFFTEANKKKFEDSLEKYLLQDGYHLPAVPEPRIFMTGSSGSGLKTQSQRLQERLKVPILHFRKEFKKVSDLLKAQRKEKRRLQKAFFPPMDENGNPVISEDFKENGPDPEIDEDPDDFNQVAGAQSIATTLLSRLGAAIVNCRLDPPPKPEKTLEEELAEENKATDADGAPAGDEGDKEDPDDNPDNLLKQSLFDLLRDTNKLPEILFILQVGEKEMLQRKFNKKKIQDIYDAKMAKINRLKEKAVEKKIEELRQERKQRKDDAADTGEEIDMDAPIVVEPDQLDAVYQAAGVPEEPDLAKMLEEEQQRLIAKWNDEKSKLESLEQAMTEAGVKVVMFEANKDIEKVYKKINGEVKQILDDRDSLFARSRVYKIEDTEALTLEKILKHTLSSGITKESRFGKCNPLEPSHVVQTTDFPVFYNHRVFYLADEEQRNLVLRNPLKYLGGGRQLCPPVAPKDVWLRPKVLLLGKYKSGKTTLADRAAKTMGLVYLHMAAVLELFAKNKHFGKSKLLFDTLANGETPSDQLLVELLALRVQFSDVVAQGYLLEGFPQTKAQALLMYEYGVIPDVVISEPLDEATILERASQPSPSQDRFEYDPEIMRLRLDSEANELRGVENLFTYNFGNVRRLTKDSNDSKLAEVEEILKQVIKGRQSAAVGINMNQPFEASKLSIKKSTILGNIAPSLTFSAVSLKKYGAIEQMFIRTDPLIFYENHFFLLKDEQQVKDFCKNPEIFKETSVTIDQVARIPTLPEIHQLTPELRQYCPVELMAKNLVKASKHLSLVAFNKLYCFSSLRAMRVFFKNPTAFRSIALPDKIDVLPLAKTPSDTTLESAKSPVVQPDLQGYLQNELSRLIVKALNQASKFRLKYPTISVESTSLKLVSLCLKSSNPNSSEELRNKYKDKMKIFISDCLLANQVYEEHVRRGSQLLKLEYAKLGMSSPVGKGGAKLLNQQKPFALPPEGEMLAADIEGDNSGQRFEDIWTAFHEEHFLRLAEEFESLMKRVKLKNPEEYFNSFIR